MTNFGTWKTDNSLYCVCWHISSLSYDYFIVSCTGFQRYWFKTEQMKILTKKLKLLQENQIKRDQNIATRLEHLSFPTSWSPSSH